MNEDGVLPSDVTVQVQMSESRILATLREKGKDHFYPNVQTAVQTELFRLHRKQLADILEAADLVAEMKERVKVIEEEFARMNEEGAI